MCSLKNYNSHYYLPTVKNIRYTYYMLYTLLQYNTLQYFNYSILLSIYTNYIISKLKKNNNNISYMFVRDKCYNIILGPNA